MGLITPSSSTVTVELAARVLVPVGKQVAVWPLVLQNPTTVPPEFLTAVFDRWVISVPEGNVIVILLPATADIAPVEEVLNAIE